MKKTFVYIVILLILVLGGWYWYTSQSSTTRLLHADLYPLYSGASWGEPQQVTTSDGPAYEVQSVPLTNVTNLAEKFTPFESYYEDKLTKAGWVRDMMREASGAGAEVSVYTKGSQFIIVSYHSIFHVQHPDAPSDCPCDVQFSLMSGTQVGPTPAQVEARHVYTDAEFGFTLRLPTEVALAKSDSQYSVDTAYQYALQGPNMLIPGVKFTIPTSLAAGTNLSSDSYISVEHLPAGKSCDAQAFMQDVSARSHMVTEGAVSYSVASSTDAGAGNRYEETVYARTGSNPCIAVRYFIHYGAIENFPEGSVKAFDKTALLQEFDQIRRTLRLQ